VLSSIVLYRLQQRGTVPLSAVTIRDPHRGDMHRGTPDVAMCAACDAPFAISQKACNRSRRFVPDDVAVKASNAVNQLAQLIRGWMLV